MKLKAVEKLCKASGCVRLYDELPASIEETRDELVADMRLEGLDPDNYDIDDMIKNPDDIRQWISDGVGAYPLDGLPYLDEESVCAIFDIDAKKRDKLVVSHAGTLPEGMDFTDIHQGDDRLEQLDFQMSLGGNELTLFRDGGGGLVVIKSAYRKPLEAWNECECFKRVDSEGRPYVAVMSGCILRALIYPYKIGEQLVETLGAVYNAAGVAAEQEQMRI
jgi:diadenosine tetraphosphatase ApaH/serine/threonine PP2A family protein phosphatase